MGTLAVSNQKGGVGKTTTCLNLAAQSATKGRTLVIDCDKQANLSASFGMEKAKTTINDLFRKRPFEIYNARKNLDIIPSSIEFAGIDLAIQNEFSRETILKKAVEKFKDDYDYIFIDCPPDMNLVTVNALTAADYVIIPIKAEQYSIDGVDIMINFIKGIRENLNNNLIVLGLLLTHYDKRLKISKTIQNDIIENGWEEALFETFIHTNTAIVNSQHKDHRMTIFEYDRKSTGAMDYMKLGSEVLQKIKNIK